MIYSLGDSALINTLGIYNKADGNGNEGRVVYQMDRVANINLFYTPNSDRSMFRWTFGFQNGTHYIGGNKIKTNLIDMDESWHPMQNTHNNWLINVDSEFVPDLTFRLQCLDNIKSTGKCNV